MIRGISVAFFFLELQYGLFMFVYPQSIIQSESSGHWFVVMLGWLLQGVLLWFLIGGFKAEPTDLLAKFVRMGRWFRYGFIWPYMLSNLMVIGAIVRGHSEIISMLYLPRTPILVMCVLLLLTSMSIAYAGRDSLLRLALVIGIFCLPMVTLTFLVIMKYMNYHLAFPMQPLLTFLKSPKILPALFVFTNPLSLIGFAGPMSASTKRWVWGAWAISIIIFMNNVYVPIGVLGLEVADRLRFPLLILLDSVRISWFFFDRMSLFYIMAIMFGTLINISGLLWLSRQLTVQSSFFPRLIMNPAAVAMFSLVVAYIIPDLETLERLLRWGGPLRCGLLVILVCIAAYVRRRTRKGDKPIG